MARTSPLHWIGVLLILLSAILLLITSVSAPAVKDIAILKVMLSNKTHIRNSSVTFGSFGHCILDVPPVDTDQDYCFKHQLGYSPAVIMANIDGTKFSTAAQATVDGLTRAMILHPIASALAFIAFLASCGAGVIGSLIGASIAALAWILTLVVMVIDFSIFGVVKNHVNNNDKSGSHAYYSTGMWTVLAAFILLLLGMFIVLFTCFSARKEKKRANTYKNSGDAGYDGINAAPKKKSFGIF